MNNRAKFIKEANSMLIGMAPHIASRKTANMLREAVEIISTLENYDEWSDMDSAKPGLWILITDSFGNVWQGCWAETDKCWRTESGMKIPNPIGWRYMPRPRILNT